MGSEPLSELGLNFGISWQLSTFRDDAGTGSGKERLIPIRQSLLSFLTRAAYAFFQKLAAEKFRTVSTGAA